jgi:hypothetical protein
MTPETFHPFSRLPKELRDEIWALAIRPDGPAAHFFTIFDSSKDDEWAELSQLAIRYPLAGRCSLAAPECVLDGPAPRQFSWVRGNRSAYWMDSGLWTACAESRDAILRRFKVAQRDREEAAADLETFRETHPDAPARVSVTSDGERRCCLTHPRTDLFFLRPFNATTAVWECLYYRVPIFNPEGTWTPCVGHVGIDYDPDWPRQMSDPSSWASWASPGTIGFAIRAATDGLSWAENLWFVDYRIRRSPRGVLSTATAGGRRQFHGDGCRFTEVQKGDAGWELNNPDGTEVQKGDAGWELDSADGDGLRDIFDFLKDALWERVDEYFQDHGEDSPYVYAGVSHLGAPDLGVLAYEEEECCSDKRC